MSNGTIADEREVLAACLDRLYVGSRQAVRSMTRSGLYTPTDEEKMLSYVREHFEGLGEKTLADFLAKNREQHPIDPDLNPGERLICIDDEDFRNIFRDEEGWDRFRQTYPESDGTLRFSRVGFNSDVTQAMIYAGQQFDWDVGSNGYWLFSKSDGVWVESGTFGEEVS